MVNRKKRLSKGIESLREQINLHEEKLESAQEQGMEELVCYYNKEIQSKKDDLDKKKKMLEKQ